MVDQTLTPCMQHRDHRGLGAEMTGIEAIVRTATASALNRMSKAFLSFSAAGTSQPILAALIRLSSSAI